MVISRSIHVDANGIISFFLWLSNSPLCVCVCTHIYTFIRPFISGHLGCFHVLATVNSAAVSSRVHVSFQIIRVPVMAQQLTNPTSIHEDVGLIPGLVG